MTDDDIERRLDEAELLCDSLRRHLRHVQFWLAVIMITALLNIATVIVRLAQ